MQLRHSITHDTPADSVGEMLSDPAFRERRCDAMGVLDRRHAALEVDTPGRPSRIRGTLTLTESAGRTTETFDGEVEVTVPLIGEGSSRWWPTSSRPDWTTTTQPGWPGWKETAEMHFHQELQYDAPPAEVYAMLSDPAFREAVCEAGDSIRHEVSITPNGDGMTVAVDQVQPAAGIPSFAKKIVGDEIEILQREEWHSPTDAGLEVTIPHKPGHLNGTVTLRESGGGTVETVDAEIKVQVPLIGGKLEKLIADLLSAALRSEERVGKSWLAGDR